MLSDELSGIPYAARYFSSKFCQHDHVWLPFAKEYQTICRSPKTEIRLILEETGRLDLELLHVVEKYQPSNTDSNQTKKYKERSSSSKVSALVGAFFARKK